VKNIALREKTKKTKKNWVTGESHNGECAVTKKGVSNAKTIQGRENFQNCRLSVLGSSGKEKVKRGGPESEHGTEKNDFRRVWGRRLGKGWGLVLRNEQKRGSKKQKKPEDTSTLKRMGQKGKLVSVGAVFRAANPREYTKESQPKSRTGHQKRGNGGIHSHAASSKRGGRKKKNGQLSRNQ